MPAKINIISGLSSGSSFWVEDPVVRIGSHPDVDLCFATADLAEHVATVEFRDGSFIVYNRAQQPIQLGDQSIGPGVAGHWVHDGELRLGNDIVLQLELSGDGSPSPPPIETEYLNEEVESVVGDSPTAEEIDDSTEQLDSAGDSTLKTIGQLAVIVFCVIAGGLMVYYKILKPPSDTGSVSSDAPKFETVVQGLRDSINEASTNKSEKQTFENSIELLRQAEFARLRGDNPRARQHFVSLRMQLVKRIEATTEEDKKKQSQDFLNYVLAALESVPVED